MEIVKKPWYSLLFFALGISLYVKGIIFIFNGVYLGGTTLTFIGVVIILFLVVSISYLKGLGSPIPFNRLKLNTSYNVFKIIEFNDRLIGHERLGVITFDNGFGYSFVIVKDIPIELKEGIRFTRKKEESKTKIKLVIN